MKNLLWLLCAFVFTTGIVSSARAEEEGLGQHAGTIIVPENLKMAEVQRSIKEGAVNREWTIRKSENDRVAIYKEDGSWISQITFVYDTKEIQIYSKTVKSGVAKLPESWIKDLKKEITKILNTKSILK